MHHGMKKTGYATGEQHFDMLLRLLRLPRLLLKHNAVRFWLQAIRTIKDKD